MKWCLAVASRLTRQSYHRNRETLLSPATRHHDGAVVAGSENECIGWAGKTAGRDLCECYPLIPVFARPGLVVVQSGKGVAYRHSDLTGEPSVVLRALLN